MTEADLHATLLAGVFVSAAATALALLFLSAPYAGTRAAAGARPWRRGSPGS
jgi:hypothetical protein